MLMFPDSTTLPTSPFLDAILSMESSSSTLPQENSLFLWNLPPLQEYPANLSEDHAWYQQAVQQGELIKKALIKNYPLGFAELDEKVVSYAAVAPIKVEINQGAWPINRTTSVRVRAGMEKTCHDLIENLLH